MPNNSAAVNVRVLALTIGPSPEGDDFTVPNLVAHGHRLEHAAHQLAARWPAATLQSLAAPLDTVFDELPVWVELVDWALGIADR